MPPMRSKCSKCGKRYGRMRTAVVCIQCRGEQKRKTNAGLLDEFFKDGCVICGETDREVLDAHHIVPVNGNRERRVQSSLGIWTRTQLEKELEGCIPLCANDHRRIHARTRSIVWDKRKIGAL